MDRQNKTGTIISTILVVCFILFVLSMCSHRPTPSQLQHADQHDDGADYR